MLERSTYEYANFHARTVRVRHVLVSVGGLVSCPHDRVDDRDQCMLASDSEKTRESSIKIPNRAETAMATSSSNPCRSAARSLR